MKMLITTVALAAVLATPALSQTTRNQSRTYDPYAYARDLNGNPSDYQSQARARRSLGSRNDVYDQRGAYVGSDPDPLVRDQLRRDPGQGNE
jgi:hypothetical protein